MYQIAKATWETGTEIEPATSLLKEVLIWGDKQFEKRRNKTIMDFYINLLEGNVSEERIKYEKEYIKANDEQYYILLNLAINEEEQEKIFIYSNVFKFIRNNKKLEKKEKIRLIKVAKALPYSAIELLPYFYIYKNYHTKNKSYDTFLKELSFSHRYEINAYVQYDIFIQYTMTFKDRDFDIKDEKIFNELCIAFFTKERLIPSKYNIDIWEYRKVLILTNKNTDESIEIQKISKILDKFNIPYKTMELFSSSLSQEYTDFIIIKHQNIGSNISEEVDSFTTNHKIIEVTSTYPKELIKNTRYLNLNDENDIEKLKKKFSE